MKPSLTLASGSFTRKQMLLNAGYKFNVIPADIDEEKITRELIENNNIEKISLILSQEKASSVSLKFPKNYIVGSDQILIMDNKIYNKAKNKAEAKQRIKEFQGKTHKLISAVSVFKNNHEIFSSIDDAELTMKNLNEQCIEKYCNNVADILTSCVGCYALESVGIRLFEKVEGNYFTILGMPLLPLVNFLDKEGFGL